METKDFSKIGLTCFKWLNEPKRWKASKEKLEFFTDEKTDFWQQTYYNFAFNTGHVFGIEIKDNFTMEVCVEADFTTLYDQAGVMIYDDERHWLKAGIEYNDGQPMIGSVLTNEVSDWATECFKFATSNAVLYLRTMKHEDYNPERKCFWASSKQLRRLWTNMRQRQREAMVRARQIDTVAGQPSTDKDLVASDITVLNTAPNPDSQEIIKQEFSNATQPSSTSLQIPPSVSPLPSTVPPPLVTLAAPLPCPSLTHLPQPQVTQIHHLSYHGREKIETEFLSTREKCLEEREYEYKKHLANEVHELEMEVLREKLREAKAKAELAEFYLKVAKKGVFPGDPRKFYLRLTRLNDVVCVKYSVDNAAWTLLRLSIPGRLRGAHGVHSAERRAGGHFQWTQVYEPGGGYPTL